MMSLAKKCYLPLSDLLMGLTDCSQLPEVGVSGVTIDSRAVKAGDCFVALKGTVTDGAHYIQQSISAGAVVVLVDQASEVEISISDISVPVISIEDLTHRVSQIAGRFYSDPSHGLNIAAFTGTNGKTTCSQLYAQLLASVSIGGEVAKSAYIGTAGYAAVEPKSKSNAKTVFAGRRSGHQLTTPDAVAAQRILAELANSGSHYIALEASSHSLVQQRLQAVQIDTAVFTNLSRDHLDYHQTIENYAAAKASLFALPSVKTAIINLDDAVGEQIITGLRADISLLTYSLENQAADIYCTDISYSALGSSATIQTPWGSGKLQSSLLGEFNLSNLLAVIATACAQGAVLSDCLQVAKTLQAVTGRMELISSAMQPQVIVDYAHTPDALEKALCALKPYCAGNLWVVFGCGGNRDSGKRKEMGKVASQFADKVVITNDNPRFEAPEKIAQQIVEGITGDVEIELDRRRAIATSIIQANKQDIVLIAGKGHENYQIIENNRIEFSDQEEALAALQTAQLSGSASVEGGIV
jgi:UDP-N-acetylmuramoyl-L-alanyl-D-glutamate--2,6-diaminopimelate ligase